MPLERLHLHNFRLFKEKVFNISEGTNLILGKNGSGKTSILESLNILISGKSFRTQETKECINQNKNFLIFLVRAPLQKKISYSIVKTV